MPISLLANTEINDMMVNYTDTKDMTQPEVMAYLQEIMHGRVVITQEFYKEIMDREGIKYDDVLVLGDDLEVYSQEGIEEGYEPIEDEIKNFIETRENNVVVFGSQELYELVFPYADEVFMVRHHFVNFNPMNMFPEITYKDWKVTYTEKLDTKKKYGYDMSYVTYARKQEPQTK